MGFSRMGNCAAMSREFPDWVDPWKAADGRRAFQGTMPLKWMKRLAPLLARPEGGLEWRDARFSAAFGYDRQGMATVDIHVEAALPLVCQRSLEPYLEKVSRHSVLAVVESVEEQDLVPEHYEPVLAENGRLALRDLVEDELLLAVPQVPRNPELQAVRRSTDEAAVSGGEAGQEPTHRPFEDLADLLGKGGT
jgi:uncharacterized protein